jgi:hypothetical protein
VIASITGDTIVESDVVATRLREDELEVYGRLQIASNGTSAGTSRVNALTIDNGGAMDLSDNKLIVAHGDVGSFAAGVYDGISGMIQRGYDFSAWDGDGLVTTRPDALSGLTTLAVASADETFYAGGTFGGVAAASGDVAGHVHVCRRRESRRPRRRRGLRHHRQFLPVPRDDGVRERRLQLRRRDRRGRLWFDRQRVSVTGRADSGE